MPNDLLAFCPDFYCCHLAFCPSHFFGILSGPSPINLAFFPNHEIKLNFRYILYMLDIRPKIDHFCIYKVFFLSNLQFRYNSCIVFGQMNQMPTKMHRDCMEAGWLIYVRRSQLLEGLPQSLGRNVLDHIDDMCNFWLFWNLIQQYVCCATDRNHLSLS